MSKPIGTRKVLVANIGQYDSTKRFIPSASYFFLKDSDSSGGSLPCTIFAERSQMSTAIGDPVFSSFKPNQQIFIRRIRIASELQAYGVALRNKGGLFSSSTSQVPTLDANSTFFQLWTRQLSDNAEISKVYESYTTPLLNEWYDVNQLVYPFGGGDPGQSFYLAAKYSVGLDCKYAAADLVTGTELVQLRLEVEIDCPIDCFNAAPLIPPTVTKAASIWSLDQSILDLNLAADSVMRAKYTNKFSQAIKKMRVGFGWSATGGLATLVGASVGVGAMSGSFNMQPTTWNDLAFSANPSYVPSGSHSLDSPLIVLSDSVTLSTPIAPNDFFVISAGYNPGLLSYLQTDSKGSTTTPDSGWYVETRFNNATATNYKNDVGFPFTNGQPFLFFVVEF